MTFEVETAQRKRVVDIVGAHGTYQAAIDGRAWAVDAARVGGAWSLLVSPAQAGHYDPRRSYEVRISAEGAGELTVHVNGRRVAVTVVTPAVLDRRRGVRRLNRQIEPTADTLRGPQLVVAPMPGRILKVLVSAGDAVAARQGLVVVEAMKMENELRSPRAGIVKEVRVRQGALVEANAVLVVIE